MARKGIVVQYAVKWDEWDQTPDMTWEPPENLSNAKEEVVKFERRVAAMPSRDAFSGPTASPACCYATCCKVADRADVETSQCFVCAKMVHPACATQHLFLEPFIQKLDSANICRLRASGCHGGEADAVWHRWCATDVRAVLPPAARRCRAHRALAVRPRRLHRHRLAQAFRGRDYHRAVGHSRRQMRQVQVGCRRTSRLLVLQGRHLPRHACVPWGAARAGAVLQAQELPLVLPKVLPKGKAALSKHLAAPAPAPTKKRSRR